MTPVIATAERVAAEAWERTDPRRMRSIGTIMRYRLTNGQCCRIGCVQRRAWMEPVCTSDACRAAFSSLDNDLQDCLDDLSDRLDLVAYEQRQRAATAGRARAPEPATRLWWDFDTTATVTLVVCCGLLSWVLTR